MQISSVQPSVFSSPVTPVQPEATAKVSGADSGVAALPLDTVEVSEEAAAANSGRVNPKGKAIGHARVAQNIEKNVAKLIERETARVERAGGDASSLDAFRAKVEAIAAAYTADPSGPPARVLSDIRDAVTSLRAGAPSEPEEVDAGEPGAEPLPTDAPAELPLDVPAEPAPTPEPELIDERIVADLSGLRNIGV